MRQPIVFDECGEYDEKIKGRDRPFAGYFDHSPQDGAWVADMRGRLTSYIGYISGPRRPFAGYFDHSPQDGAWVADRRGRLTSYVGYISGPRPALCGLL
jgi:hypothetical protein